MNKARAEKDFTITNSDLNIIDLVKDTESKEVLINIETWIHKIYDEEGTLFTVNVSNTDLPEEGKLNIVVIHEKDFYENDDPYQNRFPGCVIQHVTIEEFNKDIKHSIRTVMNEMLIKQDIINGKISMYDWEKLGVLDNMLFITKEIVDDEKYYKILEVSPSGKLKYVQKQDFDSIDEYTKYLDYFFIDEEIDNVVVHPDGVVSIWDTGWFTVPNINEINQYLREGNTKIKGKEKRTELYEAITDIKSFIQDDGNYYYVGVIGDGMQSAVATSSHIRKYEVLSGNPDLNLFLELMDNQFVRNGQLTVLPFPFKYLNEIDEEKKS